MLECLNDYQNTEGFHPSQESNHEKDPGPWSQGLYGLEEILEEAGGKRDESDVDIAKVVGVAAIPEDEDCEDGYYNGKNQVVRHNEQLDGVASDTADSMFLLVE
ncbi:hypothetical protein BCON_0065g00010 [Botryotinia convoluta]|uniref:Uncharacterized protein n=1 Tax=Botryotinia convoluta TaxID=54673 RepID=A0A4Z1I771_9HELO|nr:hypothetical protein BCON_0065g00010 [Botryotinia convoluta]